MAEKMTPRILPGFMELLPPEQILFNSMYDTIRRNYEKFGFLPLDTPTIELSEVLLAKAGGETEKQIYRFEKGDNDLSLRFDLTVPLARYVAQHSQELAFPFKRYQMSKVFRGERPQKGRFREFYQCDIDVIGDEKLDLIYDAEMPAVIYNVFRELNIGKFTIKLNNRKILSGFFESLNLSDRVTDILRTIDKFDKIGAQKMRAELISEGIPEADADKILSFITISGSADEKIASLNRLGIDNALFCEGVDELAKVVGYMRSYGIDDAYFNIELTIARGLDYYTGTVYETNLDDYPALGSVCSGGRYDNLTAYYTDRKLPGIGISIGLTRLFSQLLAAGIISADKKSLVKVLVVPTDLEKMNACLEAARFFRNEDIPCDVYSLDKGLKQKMKYAGRLAVPFVALIGDDELRDGKVALKNMQSGEQTVVTVAEAAEIMKK